MKFKQLTISIGFIFICSGLFVFYRIHSSKSRSLDIFYYNPSDTYCPIPIFQNEKPIPSIQNDNCISEFHDWIFIRDNYLIFNETEYLRLGGFRCYAKQIYWLTDFDSVSNSSWNIIFNNTYLENQIIKVLCKSKGLFNYNEHYITGFENKKSKNSNYPDILIVGIDSVSRLAWKRFLPISYNYLNDRMNSSSVIFEKVNVRGDGTTVNLLALLTGEEETELYESRRNEPGAKHVDDYPWIWKTLSEKNYATFFDEEDVDFGTFQYRLLGFRKKPTDYYGRILRLVYKLKRRGKLCLNQRNNFQFQIDLVEQFYKNIKAPKFAMSFSSLFSHDFIENVRKLDTPLLEFLKKVNDPTSIYNNSIFILFSDHGHRFHSRYHLQGKYEERLPFLAINIPQHLRIKFPHLVKNMKLNRHKLVTLFDAHETILDSVNHFSLDRDYNQSGLRKMSLFDSRIPNRNCDDVKLPAHWCVCLKWVEMSIKNPDVINSVRHAIQVINKETHEYRSKCYHLRLAEILKAHLVSPSDEVIKFYKSDKDGRNPDLSDNTRVDRLYYRVLFRTIPGNSVFETTIKVKQAKNSKLFHVSIKDVDRNDKYANWIWCITDEMRDVRKFCLCH